MYFTYMNRELSWLAFNRRVLEEAEDDRNPLLERIKFLAIVATNLDEFMSVRAAALMDQAKAGITRKDFTGYTPGGLLCRIMKRTENLVADQYRTYRRCCKELEQQGVIFRTFDELDQDQQQAMEAYYYEKVFPLLTPMAIDQSRPFALVHSQNLYLSILLKHDIDPEDEELYFAILQVPSNLDRLIRLESPAGDRRTAYMLLEELIKRGLSKLFSDYTPVAVDVFRLTRNADLTIDEEGAEDLLEEMEKELHRRRWGTPIRLEIEQGFHPEALKLIMEEFELGSGNLITIDGPIDLSFLMKLSSSLPGQDTLRYPKAEPVYPPEFMESEDLFKVIRQRDVLVFHPYESFEAVNDFIADAANDPAVMAIKMTLYRVSGDSVIVRSLARAAEAGKQVTVVLELKARFDEERNIAWAKKLEQAGCHVIYGLVGLKTHAKVALIIRQEESSLQRYVHIGTGNYNDSTSKLYTDIGLFTSHPRIGEDVTALFNEITGYSTPHDWKALCVAPSHLKPALFEYIEREMAHAEAGRPARIVAKMNSLSHGDMVDKLYEASLAGVQIDLMIRGICVLRPGVPGLSENITVRSIVDRFLEHSRVFYFENGGDPQVWLSSADWMSRNLTRRVELMCPIYDVRLRELAIRYLLLQWGDNVKTRQLMPSGKYVRIQTEGTPVRSQFDLQDQILSWKSDRVR
ncbi:polyphosphate kinase 1 [Cohnella terricola]|uniref:Polyphosphate kinase n=1 Tax=Cohnella terricola TaxID=1289167 RepID=A0A559JWD7_9BACL|nr:polyphosphate kinase 1 [Cohnella terricola]TVY04199.1 polyphosphate kinase 1 [Cohnella terricola]